MTKMTLNGGVKCWCTLFNAFLSMILFNTTLFITATNATHFRGGTVWWSPSVDFSDASPQVRKFAVYLRACLMTYTLANTVFLIYNSNN